MTVLKSKFNHKETPAFAFWQDPSLKKSLLFGSMSFKSKKLLVRLKGLMVRRFQFMPEVYKALSKRSRSSEKSPIFKILSCRKRLSGSLINSIASISSMPTSLLRMANLQLQKDTLI